MRFSKISFAKMIAITFALFVTTANAQQKLSKRQIEKIKTEILNKVQDRHKNTHLAHSKA